MKKYLLIALSLFIYTCDDDDPAGPVSGCMTEGSCNYNALAVVDDGSCWTATTGCTCQDPEGATVDACDVCDGDDSSCADCAGTPNGSALLDNCGVCDTDSTNDCVQDECGTWGGSGTTDECGTCDEDSANDCVQDCEGTWGGTAVADCAGTCGGSAVADCAGTCNGSAVEDCAGTCGGSATADCAGTCNGSAVADCAGTCNGSAVVDCAGTCSGTAAADCAGTCNGSAVEDDCGVCAGDGSSCAALSCSALPDGVDAVYIAADGDVYYSASEAVGGFQFVLEGATFSGAAGGAAQDAGFVVQGGGTTVLGFSFTGSTLPATESGGALLTTLTLTGTPTGLSTITMSTASAANMHDTDATDACVE